MKYVNDLQPQMFNRNFCHCWASKCRWPLRGLKFKLKNLVTPPLELNIDEKKEWKLMKCEILLNGTDSFLKFWCLHRNVTFMLFHRKVYYIPWSKYGSIALRWLVWFGFKWFECTSRSTKKPGKIGKHGIVVLSYPIIHVAIKCKNKKQRVMFLNILTHQLNAFNYYVFIVLSCFFNPFIAVSTFSRSQFLILNERTELNFISNRSLTGARLHTTMRTLKGWLHVMLAIYGHILSALMSMKK